MNRFFNRLLNTDKASKAELPDFYIHPAKLRIIQDFMASGIHVAFTGSPGTGKTELARKIAAASGLPWLMINVGTIRSPGDWWGYMEYREGVGTFFHKTRLTHALETGKPHVIILNELNRCSPYAHNPIFDLLDGNRSVYLEQTDTEMLLHEDTVFLATLNEGRAHTGTYQADAAIEDRFEFVRLALPPEEKIAELLQLRYSIGGKEAKLLAAVSSTLYQMGEEEKLTKQFGLRPAISAAKLLARGNPMGDALLYTFASRFWRSGPQDSEYKLVLQVLQGLMPPGTFR